MTKAEIQAEQLSRVTESFKHYMYEDESSLASIRADIIDMIEFLVESKHMEGRERFIYTFMNLHRMTEAIESEYVFKWRVLETPQKEQAAKLKARDIKA